MGIPLHSLPSSLQLCVCICGVMVFYLLYGYVQVRGLSLLCIDSFVQSNGNCHLSILSHGHTHTRTALQEWIFQIEGFKPYGWYLTLVQFALYSLFGGVEMATTGDWVRRSVQAFCN